MTDAPVDTTNTKPADAPADKPAESAAPVADKPADAPADKPAEGADAPVDGAKPADKPADAPAEGEKPKEEDKPVKRAPEKYDLKLAEGVKLNAAVTEKIEAFARANDLPQEQAQAIIDLAPEVNKMFTEQLIETAKATSTMWAEQSRADKELSNGGDPKVLEANLAMAAKARDAFASPELNALLNTFDAKKNPNGTGLGNHPEVIRLFTRLGKAISEDNKLISGGTPSGEKSAAEKMYPTKK